jgi:mono/diheme cytochrome c family protein
MNTLISSKKRFVLCVGFFSVTAIFFIVGCSTTKEKGPTTSEKGLKGGTDPKPNSDPKVSEAGAKRGQELFDTIGCMGCHIVNGKGGAVGPDLSDEADKGRSRQWLTTQIRDPRSNDPESIMPAYNNLSKEKINDLVDYLMTLSKNKSSQDKMPAGSDKTAKNSDGASGSENISLTRAGEKWSEICGRCHNLRSPSEYSDSQWTVAMDHMRLIVPLTVQEQHEVLEFLKANN